MITSNIENSEERKAAKRAARKEAAPKAKRPASVARGSMKKKVKIMSKGQTRKR